MRCLQVGFGFELTINRRRLARRGGVKRLSAPIYEDTRDAIKDRLALVSGMLLGNLQV